MRWLVCNGFGGEMINKEANSIPHKVVEFYQLEVEAITQALPLRYFIGGIDPKNIINSHRMSYSP